MLLEHIEPIELPETIQPNPKSRGCEKDQKQKTPPMSASGHRRRELLADTICRALSHRESNQSRSHSVSVSDQGIPARTVSMWLSVPTNNDSSSTESTYSYMTSSSSTRPPSFSSSSSYDPRSEADSRGTAGSTETVPHVPSHPCTRYPSTLRVASLSGKASIRDVEQLAVQYGSMAHMGLLDPSYSVFVNEAKTGAICFKTLYKIAVVMGDPMCDLAQIASLLSEFSLYRRRKRWGMAVLGAKTELVRYFSEGEAESRSTILQFARERVLNPLTNSVVNETSGKRILTQCRQLLDARKGGLTLHIYIPSLHGPDHRLEVELRALYDDWRTARNKSRRPQAFITQYDPFLMPHLMTYIYTTGPDGAVNGFAALRWIGANDGYHIDPCIAAPGSRNGISDLLLFAAMAYLRQLGVSHLSLGLEPLESIEPVSEMSPLLAHLTQRIYQHTFRRLPIPGKRAYFDKFKPDDNQDAPVYLIFSSTIPEPRQVVAVAHIANISIRRLFIREKQKEAS